MKRILKYIFILIVGMSIISCSSGKHISRNRASVGTIQKKNQESVRLSTLQKKLVNEAMSWQNTPYKYGGAEKGEGTDCSGLVLRIYETVTGIKLPRNSLKQAEFCKKIKSNEVCPGDLVFFATGKDPDRISHVGMMIDDDRFIHSSTTKGVCISSVSAPYYIRTFKMFGRVP